MQVNPEDGPPEIYVTWSDPRMTDFENGVGRSGNLAPRANLWEI